MKRIIALLTFTVSSLLSGNLYAQPVRQSVLLDKGWKFTQADAPNYAGVQFDDSKWQKVTIPHDWAINGPFDRKYDLQTVVITQNNETSESVKTGRTGGLPYIGVGWYRRTFDVPNFDASKQTVNLVFDGAMSEAKVYINGRMAFEWPYGYNSFHFDASTFINPGGKNNTIAVRLENRTESSRWYPGAGLYRNVHMVITDKVHVPLWGTYITTPYVSEQYASVRLKTNLENAEGKEVTIKTQIINSKKEVVAEKTTTQIVHANQPIDQSMLVSKPSLWSPNTPALYTAMTDVYVDGNKVDSYSTRFGVRSFEVITEKGILLNGKPIKFQGVCNHHDLGPLGAAVSKAALKRQLVILKDMGCNAIRTSHNMPAPELIELCDEMGFMVMVEPFDEWELAKCKNGYHRFFNKWAEKDMVNMLRQYRNSASVVMWSIGNEVPTQCDNQGYKVASFLQDICHREDPTRPVTCGMDQVSCVLSNGFAALIDVPGFNYRAHRYTEGYNKLPQGFLLGSETTSTVSSRGIYKFPVEVKADAIYPDNQSSSYDVEYSNWANIPDIDLANDEDYEWTLGQFVWTGFDYLGEPAPYDTDAWPSHSSLYGIVDLASIPKDRYFLYRSIWNKESTTLHVLPHWTWPGREGKVTPVFVYTSYPSAELFINGKSQGIRHKDKSSLLDRYRLRWMNTVYTPGEIRVIVYDSTGKACEEKTIRTAGKPHQIVLTADRQGISADGKDLAYINVSIVDKDGNLCPSDTREITFEVTGNGTFRAAANGDATCLTPFNSKKLKLFSGQLTMIIQAAELPGMVEVKASAKGVAKGTLLLKVERK